MLEERRVRRTEDPKRALSMFLASCRAQTGAHAIAVATRDGRLVAGAGDGALLVAVMAARAAAGGDVPQSLAVSRCGRYVIASLGEALDASIAAGVTRILS